MAKFLTITNVASRDLKFCVKGSEVLSGACPDPQRRAISVILREDCCATYDEGPEWHLKGIVSPRGKNRYRQHSSSGGGFGKMSQYKHLRPSRYRNLLLMMIPNAAYARKSNSGFDFLYGLCHLTVSEMRSAKLMGGPQLYVVIWNDDFFVLKVECDAYYIIDTLGERLHEGCDQAYILKFDESLSIHRNVSKDKAASLEPAAIGSQGSVVKEGSITETCKEDVVDGAVEEQQQLICKGKESCKEYIKGFLAAILVRELQADIKGRTSSVPD